jgi:hypothetical protein
MKILSYGNYNLHSKSKGLIPISRKQSLDVPDDISEWSGLKLLEDAGCIKMLDGSATQPKPQSEAEAAFHKFMNETSGGFHSTDQDWTTVGMDEKGWPVVKGSPEDVSNPVKAKETKPHEPSDENKNIQVNSGEENPDSQTKDRKKK